MIEKEVILANERSPCPFFQQHARKKCKNYISMEKENHHYAYEKHKQLDNYTVCLFKNFCKDIYDEVFK